MSSKQCLKCSHTVEYESTPPLSCPSCGAIYAKVEQALREGPPSRTAAPVANPRVRLNTLSATNQSYANKLREESIYPTFRAVIGIAYWLGVALAAIFLIGGLIGAFTAGPAPLVVGLVGGALVFIFARVFKEMSLMLADMSDATVRMAARQDRDEA